MVKKGVNEQPVNYRAENGEPVGGCKSKRKGQPVVKAIPAGEELWRVPVELIDRASYNPTNPKPQLERDNPRSKEMQKLRASIRSCGLIHPIILVREGNRYRLVDGHRRLAAHIMEGLRCILARIITGCAERLYAASNSCSKPQSPPDRLQVWVKEPEAAEESDQIRFQAMESYIGRPLVEEMALRGYTHQTYKQAIRICDACLSERRVDFVQDTIRWLMDCKGTRRARTYLEGCEREVRTMYYEIIQHRSPVGE